MQFIDYFIKLIICIFNIGTTLYFFDNVLNYNKTLKSSTRVLYVIVHLLFLYVGTYIGVILAIIGYYSILLVCGIYIKGRIKLINFFWIIQFVSNCLSVYFIVYTLGRILRKYTILALLNQSFLLDESLHLISVLLQIFIIKFHIKQKDFIEKFSNSQILISSFIFIIIQLCLIIQLLDNIGIVAFNIIYKTEISILLCCINGFLYKILIILSKEIEEKYLLEMSIKQTELEEKYIKEISEIYTNIKSWKHDYRNNINVICNLAIANEHKKLFDYIEELDKEILIAEALIYTEDFLIDSIITSKYLYGNSKKIEFNIKSEKIRRGNISDFDINIILSNILDNAIEGALKSKEKIIYIDIFEKNNNIVFKIKNTFDGKIKKINENYITTKEGNIHGLGIHRVISTVNKYNGVIYMNNDENIFENKVIIPIN